MKRIPRAGPNILSNFTIVSEYRPLRWQREKAPEAQKIFKGANIARQNILGNEIEGTTGAAQRVSPQ